MVQTTNHIYIYIIIIIIYTHIIWSPALCPAAHVALVRHLGIASPATLMAESAHPWNPLLTKTNEIARIYGLCLSPTYIQICYVMVCVYIGFDPSPFVSWGIRTISGCHVLVPNKFFWLACSSWISEHFCFVPGMMNESCSLAWYRLFDYSLMSKMLCKYPLSHWRSFPLPGDIKWYQTPSCLTIHKPETNLGCLGFGYVEVPACDIM